MRDALPGNSSWPMVSVIVPTYNDARSLRSCLSAIESQKLSGSFETIVVDNGSAQSLDEVRAAFPNIIFLYEETPGSYGARNAGIAIARGEILAFTDSDCQPAIDWLQNGVEFLLTHQEIAAIGGRIDVESANHSTASIAALYDSICSFPQRRYVEQLRFSATANLMTRKSVMNSVGPFATELRSGGDREWGNRLVAGGFRLAYVENVIVQHAVRSSKREIYKKVRRTVAGDRDLHRNLHRTWSGLVWEVVKDAAPPVREAYALLFGKGKSFPLQQKVAVLFFAWRLRLWRAYQRILLQFDNSASPRQ